LDPHANAGRRPTDRHLGSRSVRPIEQRLSQLVALARETNSAVVVLSNTARSVDRLGQRLLKALSVDAG
jgi:hypothetical protein